MTEAAAPTRDFFISFNQADRTWATWIAWVLEEEGYTVWFQDWDFGGNFVEQMNRAHEQANRTLAVLSDNYLESDFTFAEWSARFGQDPAAREDRLVPVRVGPVTRREHILATRVYADLTNCREDEARERLLQRVRKATDPYYRSKPSDRPGFPSGSPRKVPHKPQSPFNQSDGRAVEPAPDVQPRRGVSIIITVAAGVALIVFFGDGGRVLPIPGVLGALAGALMGGLAGVVLLFLLKPLLIASNRTAASKPLLSITFAIPLIPIVELMGNGGSRMLLSSQDQDPNNIFPNWYKLLFVIVLLAVIVYPVAQWVLKFGRTIAGVPMDQHPSSP
jgi:hypothetical protein